MIFNVCMTLQKLASLKEFNHEMIPYVSKSHFVVEKLKMYLEADTLEGVKKKLHNHYMVLVLHGMHPHYEHVCDQVLTGQEGMIWLLGFFKFSLKIGGNSIESV